ncbi:hypothetical protein RRG08_044737 [Elysia crispata]|uniref:Uncharacterized protein n=1 Tax=Elysia crispata TaxID=231223 RepID=A0AAE0ZJE2_9GAST|nr:hypothetical protein RRG08_044737 [Elysia crispata]
MADINHKSPYGSEPSMQWIKPYLTPFCITSSSNDRPWGYHKESLGLIPGSVICRSEMYDGPDKLTATLTALSVLRVGGTQTHPESTIADSKEFRPGDGTPDLISQPGEILINTSVRPTHMVWNQPELMSAITAGNQKVATRVCLLQQVNEDVRIKSS